MLALSPDLRSNRELWIEAVVLLNLSPLVLTNRAVEQSVAAPHHGSFTELIGESYTRTEAIRPGRAVSALSYIPGPKPRKVIAPSRLPAPGLGTVGSNSEISLCGSTSCG